MKTIVMTWTKVRPRSHKREVRGEKRVAAGAGAGYAMTILRRIVNALFMLLVSLGLVYITVCAALLQTDGVIASRWLIWAGRAWLLVLALFMVDGLAQWLRKT